MNAFHEVVNVFVGLTSNPMALVVIFAMGSMALAAWAIYAVIVAMQRTKGERE